MKDNGVALSHESAYEISPRTRPPVRRLLSGLTGLSQPSVLLISGCVEAAQASSDTTTKRHYKAFRRKGHFFSIQKKNLFYIYLIIRVIKAVIQTELRSSMGWIQLVNFNPTSS